MSFRTAFIALLALLAICAWSPTLPFLTTNSLAYQDSISVDEFYSSQAAHSKQVHGAPSDSLWNCGGEFTALPEDGAVCVQVNAPSRTDEEGRRYLTPGW